MTYAPRLQVIDSRKIVDRIFQFFAATQVDAAIWAEAANYRPIEHFYTSAAGRLNTIFPSFMVIEKQTALDASGDLNQSGVQITFEYYLDGPDTDQLIHDANDAAYVIESLLSNLPHGIFDPINPALDITFQNPLNEMQFGGDDVTMGSYTVAQGGIHQPFQLSSLETYYDVLRGSTENASAFLQLLQIRAVYLVQGAAMRN